MSDTRAEDRPDRSHVPPTPPAKLAPADDPAWAATFMLADAAREARPTTTNEETTMTDAPTTTEDPRQALADFAEWKAERIDLFTRDGDGTPDDDTAFAMLDRTAAQMVREALAPPTNKDDTRTLEWNGVTVTIGTSSGRDGAALVIIDTEGEPDGSDGWKGLRVDVNDGQVFKGVPYGGFIDDREAHRIATRLSDDMDGFLDDGAIDVATVERFEADRAHAGNLDEHEALMNYLRHHVGRGPVDGWAEWDEAPTFPTDGSTEAAP